MDMRNAAGARLAFVVTELEGTVEREHSVYSKEKGLERVMVTEPAGFLVYFPRGHVLRIKDRAGLAEHGLDKTPAIINMAGLTDPNSALGKMFRSQDAETRAEGYKDLEKAVMQLATARSGNVIMPEQIAQRPKSRAKQAA